jgi:hypothetical protein
MSVSPIPRASPPPERTVPKIAANSKTIVVVTASNDAQAAAVEAEITARTSAGSGALLNGQGL